MRIPVKPGPAPRPPRKSTARRSECSGTSSEMRRLRTGFARRARMDGERKLDLLTEPAKDRHEAVDGETPEIDVADTDELAVRDPGFRLGFPGRQFLGIKDFDDLRRQQRLGLAHISVGITEI